MGKLDMIGNLLTQWELMPDDRKNHLRELEPEFAKAMDTLGDALSTKSVDVTQNKGEPHQ